MHLKPNIYRQSQTDPCPSSLSLSTCKKCEYYVKTSWSQTQWVAGILPTEIHATAGILTVNSPSITLHSLLNTCAETKPTLFWVDITLTQINIHKTMWSSSQQQTSMQLDSAIISPHAHLTRMRSTRLHSRHFLSHIGNEQTYSSTVHQAAHLCKMWKNLSAISDLIYGHMFEDNSRQPEILPSHIDLHSNGLQMATGQNDFAIVSASCDAFYFIHLEKSTPNLIHHFQLYGASLLNI